MCTKVCWKEHSRISHFHTFACKNVKNLFKCFFFIRHTRSRDSCELFLKKYHAISLCTSNCLVDISVVNPKTSISSGYGIGTFQTLHQVNLQSVAPDLVAQLINYFDDYTLRSFLLVHGELFFRWCGS